MIPAQLFADGGVIGPNPSLLGGTYAFCHVHEGEMIHHGSGIITPEDAKVDRISNNFTECLAVLRALNSVPLDWSGTLYTDSKIAMVRITTGTGFKGLPDWFRLRLLKRRRNRKYKVVLVGGHPTKIELEQGFRKRNGFPVSKWNVWADKECQRLSKEFKNV